jgi:hypothetical protein
MNLSRKSNEFGFYTRESDGASGMTVTALADFCGTKQQTITQVLNRIRDSDAIANDLPGSLKPFAGKELRLITNEANGSRFIIDEVCQAICEHYVFEARQYKGKDIAIANFRMIAKAGMRLYIWAQTGYEPNKKPSQASLVGHWAERQRLFIQRTTIPSGWFCIFEELAKLMWQLENLGYVIPDHSPVDNSRIIPDISIGRMFCKHMRSKGYAVGAMTQKYPHWYPGWKLPVKANIYPNCWLEEFRGWFDNQWKPTRLVQYLGKKDPNSLPSIGKLLGLPEAPIQLKLFQDADGDILVPVDTDN